MLSEKQVFEGLVRIIKKYNSDPAKRGKYLKEIDAISPPPVRGIFSEMQADGIQFDEDDKDTVKDVFYYFG